jgi:hypothetical protein
MSPYSEQDFPWTFYFNGVTMPKWGANWPAYGPGNFEDWDWEIGPRDLYLIRRKIDLVGSIESANAHAFLYAVQEVLCMLFTERENVLKDIQRWAAGRAEPREVYDGLVEAAFKMRELTRRDSQAIWISGYEADRLRLIEAMRRASLAQEHPDFLAAPHIKARTAHLQRLWRDQIGILRAAASKRTSKENRKRLMEL